MGKLPKQYEKIREKFGAFHEAHAEMGKAAREAGPLEEKTAQLIQLAAASALRSEGAVHSHARRAREAGASPEEVRHAVILITSTVGFPTASAALSWVEDVIR
jgi:AhpD family alkylhydroperoxidase